MVFFLDNHSIMIFPPTPRQCRMAARSQFFVTVFAEKQIQRAAPKKLLLSSTGSYVYIIGSYGLGRKPISPLCKVTTACTLLPAHSTHFPCSCKPFNYSSLVISCLSLPHSSKWLMPVVALVNKPNYV